MDEAFPEPRVLLKRYGLHAKKSWGQNFLNSERAYRAIVDATVRADDDWIVEIGAGLGTLTMRLAQRIPEGRLFAVERDRDLVHVLQSELGSIEEIDIVEADAMKYDFATVARWRGESITVCGNLPYQISSQIIMRVIEGRQSINRAVVMLQREMADRLVAQPGTKTYGALGVMVTTYADVQSVIRVPGSAFTPPPKVESAVVLITPLPGCEPRAPIDDHRVYSVVVHAAFGQRRKTLRNALRSRFDGEHVDACLAAAAIDGQRRGETLSIAEFASLSNQFGRA